MQYGNIKCLILIPFFLTNNSYAGAWTLPKDDWQLINQGTMLQVPNMRDYDAKPDYHIHSQLEYGINDDLTFGSKLGYDRYYVKLTRYKQIWKVSHYNVDNEYYLRKKLYQQDKFVWSVAASVKQPYKDNIFASNSKYEYEIRSLAGYRFRPDEYINMEVAYRHVTNFPEARLDISMGRDINDKITIYTEFFTKYYLKLPDLAISAQEKSAYNSLYGLYTPGVKDVNIHHLKRIVQILHYKVVDQKYPFAIDAQISAGYNINKLIKLQAGVNYSMFPSKSNLGLIFGVWINY